MISLQSETHTKRMSILPTQLRSTGITKFITKVLKFIHKNAEETLVKSGNESSNKGGNQYGN